MYNSLFLPVGVHGQRPAITKRRVASTSAMRAHSFTLNLGCTECRVRGSAFVISIW